MRRFTAIMLGLIAVTWLLLLPVIAKPPEPAARVVKVPRTAPAAASPVPAPTITTAVVPESTTNPKPKWAKAGLCRTPNDRAADGSRCGNRAASVRSGGK